jgi:hypothetical protein
MSERNKSKSIRTPNSIKKRARELRKAATPAEWKLMEKSIVTKKIKTRHAHKYLKIMVTRLFVFKITKLNNNLATWQFAINANGSAQSGM